MPNNASLVLLVRTPRAAAAAHRRRRAAGAAGAAGARARSPPVDVLKVPHHGSAYQDPALLAAVRPRIALISVGAGNDYGHPAPATAARAAPRRRAGRAHRPRRHPRGGRWRHGACTAAGCVRAGGLAVTAMPCRRRPRPAHPRHRSRGPAARPRGRRGRGRRPGRRPGGRGPRRLRRRARAGRLTGLASPSLFGGTTVIVVRDVADAAERRSPTSCAGVVADPGDDVVLVLVHAGGVKGKALLDAAKQGRRRSSSSARPVKWESDKVAFVQAEFKAAGPPGRAGAPRSPWSTRSAATCASSPSACSQLVADTTGTVDRAVVERYHAGRVEVTGFKVADAAVEGRYEEALRLLRHALATGVDPVPRQRGVRGRPADAGQGGRRLALGAARRRRPRPGPGAVPGPQGPRAARRLDARTAWPRRSSRWPGPTSRSRAAAPTPSTPWSGPSSRSSDRARRPADRRRRDDEGRRPGMG